MPFVGPAGQLLDDMLNIIGLDRDTVYIANIVKCRPPGNRDPLPEEMNACSGWLARQIEYVDPRVIVCVGRIAAGRLIHGDFRITREHGQWYNISGRRVIATFHPSALLRDLSLRPAAFDDLKMIEKEIRVM